MPTSAEILAGLTQIANDAFALAIVWHGAILAAAVAWLLGWRPSRRLVGGLIALPLASVAALAFAYGNPFNGAVFSALALALVALALRLDATPVHAPGPWATGAGLAMILFGWVYPHFLVGHGTLAYLYGAPTGLVPCPTLSLAIGVALITGGVGSRAWSLTLAGGGLLYGLFGAARLGVLLDVGLLAGSAALIALVVASTSQQAVIPSRR